MRRVLTASPRPFRPGLISPALSRVALPPDLLQAERDALLARAQAVLGADGRGLSDDQQVAAMALADRLRPDPRLVSARPGRPRTDDERFRWLTEQTGSATVRQVFGFLNLADAVFGTGQANLAALIRLRRVADLVPARGGLADGHGPQQVMDALVTGLAELVPPGAAGSPVSEQVRTLADRAEEASYVRLAREERGWPASFTRADRHAPVTLADLAALTAANLNIKLAHDYLDGKGALTTAQKAEAIDGLLAGAPTFEALRAAIDLMHSGDPGELTVLLDGGGPAGQVGLSLPSGHRRAERLITRIPSGHPLRAELNRFVAQRIGAGVRPEGMLTGAVNRGRTPPVRRPRRERLFRLGLISPALAGVIVRADLTRDQLDAAIAAIGQRLDDAVLRRLGLPDDERKIALAWLRRLRAAAARENELRGHFNGTPALRLLPQQLSTLIRDALSGVSRAQGVAALEALTSEELTAVVALGGGLRGLLEERIPATDDALRQRAYRFLGNRFDADGHVIPHVRPPLFAQSRPASGQAAAERGFLTREQLSEVIPAVGPLSDDAVIRRLGLDPSERQRAMRWLALLSSAFDRQEQLESYLGGNPATQLDLAQRQALARDALRGLAPWQALDLLNAVDDADLGQLTQGTGLLELAREQIPEPHPLRPELDELLARRLDPQDDTVRRVHPAQPFTLDMISPALHDLAVSDRPAGREMIRIGREILGYPDVLVDLPSLPPVPLAQARWWARHVAEPARLVLQAEDYLAGDPDAAPDLQELITGLLAAEPARFAAARLIGGLADHQLADLDRDGTLQTAMRRAIGAIPQADDRVRIALEKILSARFDDGQVRAYYPDPYEFRPDMIVPGLGRRADEALTPEELRTVARVFMGQEEDDIVSDVDRDKKRAPVQRARARWWVRAVRDAMRDWVLSHLAGNPAFELPSEDQALLFYELVHLPEPAGTVAVRALLSSIDNDELTRLAELLGRPLADFRGLVPRRFDNDGNLRGRHSALKFRPAMIAEELEDLALTDSPDDDQLYWIATRFEWQPTIRLLNSLPRREREMALWWLADIRVRLGDLIHESGGRQSADEGVQELLFGQLAIDGVLNRFYSRVARELDSAEHLISLAVVPPLAQAQRLREALLPPAPTEGSDDEPHLFVEVLSGETESFRTKLAGRIRAVIEAKHQMVAAGQSEEQRAKPGALYDAEHIVRIGELARQLINEVFGRLATGDTPMTWSDPDGSGNVLDLFDYTSHELAALDQQQLTDLGRKQIYTFIMQSADITRLLDSHNVHPHHERGLLATNEAARLLDDIIYDVLKDPVVLRSALEIWRGWGGMYNRDRIFIQRFRAATPEGRRRQLRDLLQTFIHEIMHMREDVHEHPHADMSWLEEFTIVEGFTSVLTEIVWEHAREKLRNPDNRERILRIVDGADYDPEANTQWPEPAFKQRYASYAEAMRLIRQVGIRNFYAAVLAGAGEMITGPGPGSRRSLLAPGGTGSAPVLTRRMSVRSTVSGTSTPVSLRSPLSPDGLGASSPSSPLLTPGTQFSPLTLGRRPYPPKMPPMPAAKTSATKPPPVTKRPGTPIADELGSLYTPLRRKPEAEDEPEPRAVPPVTIAPVPSTVRPPVLGLDRSLDILEQGRLRREEDRRGLARRLRAEYHSRVANLNVAAIPMRDGWLVGDCLYEAVIELFRDRLGDQLGVPPTADLLRIDFARRLSEDFDRADRDDPDDPARYAPFFRRTIAGGGVTRASALEERQRLLQFISTPGEWEGDDGDNTSSAFAHAYGLPMVLLGRDRAYDIGPAGPREGYIFYGAEHYTAGRPPRGAQVLPEAELYHAPDQTPEWRSWTEPRPEGSPELTAIERNLEIYRAGFEALREQFAALTEASPTAMTSRHAGQGFQLTAAFGNLLFGAPRSLQSQDRAGAIYAQFRQAVAALRREGHVPQPHRDQRTPLTLAQPPPVGPEAPADGLERFREHAELYLDERGADVPADLTRDEAVEGLTAVLAEAAGERGEIQWRGLRNTQVERGLRLLPPTTADTAHTWELPGVDASRLRVSARFTVTGAVTGRAGPAEIPALTLFVVRQPEARDLSSLTGLAPGTLMFPPGTPFEVVDDVTIDGLRTVELRHPGTPDAEDVPSRAVPRPSRTVRWNGEPETSIAVPPALTLSEPGTQSEPGTPSEPGAPVDPAAEMTWRLANPWWSERSRQRTRDRQAYSLTAPQRQRLNERSLQVLWVPADGDRTFTATAYTVPQGEIRQGILDAARRQGIVPPDDETDGVGWLLRQAADEARDRLTPVGIRQLASEVAKSWRVSRPSPDADGIDWLISVSVERARTALGHVGPDNPVSGQQLRFFLAYLLERNDDWRSDFFSQADAHTSLGMAAAVRQLTNDDLPYGTLFSQLIADFLDVPLDVLHKNGELEPLAGGAGEETAQPYIIVLINEHYLATVRRPDSPGEAPEPAGPEPGTTGPSSAVITGGAALAAEPVTELRASSVSVLPQFPGQDEDDAEARLAAYADDEESSEEGSGATESPEVFDTAWEEANPWWGSGERTREMYRPPASVRDRLVADGLQVHWVQAGGDCTFEAMVVTAGQDQVKELISAAAADAGIVVPQDAADPVAWVVGEAMAAAAEHARQTRDQVTQSWQEGSERLTVALEHMDAAYKILRPIKPGDPVNEQHLRLVVAFLLESRFARRGEPGGDWAPDDTFRWSEDDAPSTADTGLALTRAGMVAAVRFLTAYGAPYGHWFPPLIAHMLGAPLQVLLGQANSATGAISAATDNYTRGGGRAQHTIVLVNEHYLATSTRAVAPPDTGSPVVPRPTAEQVRYLSENRLEVVWVDADGDSNFASVTRTVPPEEIRDRIGEAARRWGVEVPPAGPGDGVTGQQLRTFLALLVERGFDAWPGATSFVADGESVLTRPGLVEALRLLGSHDEPYASFFSEVIAYFLDLPLQVLQPDGSPLLLPMQEADQVTAPHTIVLSRDHYLATVRRPDSPGQETEDPATSHEEPPPEPEDDTSDARQDPGRRRSRDVQYHGFGEENSQPPRQDVRSSYDDLSDGDLSDDDQGIGAAIDSVQMPLASGYVSARDLTEVMWEWLPSRVPATGVFDLVLEPRDDGLYDPQSGTQDVLLDTNELNDRLTAWGVPANDVIRLVVPDGARFGALMADLASRFQRPVLVTPGGAGLTLVTVFGTRVPRRDISPADVSGAQAPWQVLWPRESWEDRVGRLIVERENWFGAFMLGLHVSHTGLRVLYNREGQTLALEQPAPDHLRALGWTEGHGIVVVTERWPGVDVDSWLEDLSEALGADVFYRFDHALAGAAIGTTMPRPDLLAHEPGLFDLWLQYSDQGEPGFNISPGRFAPLRPRDMWALWNLPDAEIRLVLPAGDRLRRVADELAIVVGRPIWISSPGAEVIVVDGRAVALDGQTRRPASWVQLMPGPVLTEAPPWHDVSSGLFETRSGPAVLEFRRRHSGQVHGIVVGDQQSYNEHRMADPLRPAEPAQWYVAWIAVDPHRPVFSQFSFDGQVWLRPLRELPRLLRDHGWSAGQDIVIATNFAAAEGDARDQYWEEVTAELAQIARNEGVSVYFPSRGSTAELRYGGDLVVGGLTDPHWDSRHPSDRQARLLTDLAGRPRRWSQDAVVSVTMSGRAATAEGELRAGVASPTAEMMRARADAYNRLRTVPAAFVVDVPLTENGRIGLVYPDHQGTEAGWWMGQASPADIEALIRGGGYRPEAQVIQFLAAPSTEQYVTFARHAQRIADRFDRDVYIVGEGGAIVEYQDDLGAFAAVRGGPGEETRAVAWRLLRPSSARAHGEVPAYFHTDQDGVLVERRNASRLETFGNLVTFEPEYAVRSDLDRYLAYAQQGRGELALVVVPTLGDGAVGSGSARLRARRAAQAVANLRFNDRPVRLLFRSLDGIPPALRLEDWALDFARELRAVVYMAEDAWFRDLSRDFAADRWRMVIPETPDRRAEWMPRYVRNPVTGLLVREDLEANPLPAPLDGTDQALGQRARDLVVQRDGQVLLLAGDGMSPVGSLPGEVPDGWFVVVAHSRDGRTVMGLLQSDGATLGEPVPVPPAWMAEIIRAAAGGRRVDGVSFLVPGLGRHSRRMSAPEHYAQQVADLLQARVLAVRSDNPTGELLEARAVFDPMQLVLDIDDESGRPRLISLPPHLRGALSVPADPPRSTTIEVFLQAFEDGSLGLYYQGTQEAHPVSPWFIGQTLAPALAGRPFVIRPVRAPGTPVSRIRLFATTVEVYALIAEQSGRYRAARQFRAQALVRRLRLPLTDGAASEALAVIEIAGDAVASVYAPLLDDAPLPDGWVADVQFPGGLWIRPNWPASHVAAQRTALTELPQAPVRGLIVVGLPGRAVPPPVWQAVRRALEQVPQHERAALRLRAIDTEASARHLDDLVAVDEDIIAEAPPYTGDEAPPYNGDGDVAPATEGLGEQWAGYAAQWNEVLDRLAGNTPAPNPDGQPEGFPRDRAEAFALYRAARAEQAESADRLAELEAHASGTPSPGLRVLQERERSAALRLSQAVRWLTDWGISDPEAAARAAEEFSQARASGLAGGAPSRRLPDGGGSATAAIRLDGGFVSVSDTVRDELDPWLRNRLRVPERSDASFVSLALSGSILTVDGVPLRAGVASPTSEMIRERGWVYDDDEPDNDGLAVFVVDVPLAARGHIGLVFPGDRGGEPGWRTAAAVAEETPSGWYVRPGGAGGHRDEALDRGAARSLRPVEGAVVVHVHVAPRSGLLAVGGELLTAAEFHHRVLAGRGLVPGQVLVMVACGLGAARPGQAEAVAAELARLGDRPVVAASADVFTTADGQVVTARSGFSDDGRPVVDTASPGNWVLFEPGGAGPRVLASLALAQALPESTQVPVVRGGQASSREQEIVRWSSPDNSEPGPGRAVARPVPTAWRTDSGISFVEPQRSLLRLVQSRRDLLYLEVEVNPDGGRFLAVSRDRQQLVYRPAALARLVGARLRRSDADVRLVAHHHPAVGDRAAYEAAFGRAVGELARELGMVVHASRSDTRLTLRPEAGNGPPLWAEPIDPETPRTDPLIRTYLPEAGGAQAGQRLRDNGSGGLVPAGRPVSNPAAGRVLASVTLGRVVAMQGLYPALEVEGVLDIDFEVLPDGALASVYEDGTISFLTSQEFRLWRQGQPDRGFSGQVLRLLAAPPQSQDERRRFIDQVSELAESAEVDIYYPGGPLREDNGELVAAGGWKPAFGAGYGPWHGWFTSEEDRLVLARDPVEIRLDGGYASVSYASYLRLASWLRFRRADQGVFDLALESDVDGLHAAQARGPGALVDGRQIGEWLSEHWGLASSDVIRLTAGRGPWPGSRWPSWPAPVGVMS